ncbi:MAG: MSMEG_0569 family flavin-dependent oxidoreductase [Solirubrobacteraceae bacterium]|nr:MSMEG_0569 family flavin-dependent oxidoreductase [Solirubrobacteraceae bacterium]
MPEVDFRITWPDGTPQHCVSPSRSIEATLVAGAKYPVDEFVRRATQALRIGSDRVRAKYGFACTAAAAQSDELRQMAVRFPQGVVTVEQMGTRGGRPPAGDARSLDGRHIPVVIVGGGQAGLSASWHLCQAGIEHVVLERHRATHTWQTQRWDNFCLVTPNWQCRLPGHPYAGPDPDGFMVKDEILAYLDDFRRSFDPPLHEGVRVTRVGRDGGGPPDAGGAGQTGGEVDGPFTIETSAGTLTADQVIVAAGGYHVPSIPAVGGALPSHLTQVHSSHYKNAEVLPDGAVLVVGSGQSGAQIAEDLHLAGRQVHLAVGTAPRVARFYRGRDVVAWLQDRGHYDMGIEDHPEGTAARKEANHYVTGRGGGRDIDLRKFATEGMQLHGRLQAADGDALTFADDLAGNLDLADATYHRINAGIDAWIDEHGIDAPPAEPYAAPWHPEPGAGTALDLRAAGVSSVIWATGFRPDWSWIDLPWADASGYPLHERGVTPTAGLFVLGLPWLHTWGSGRFAAIDRDAAYLAERVAEHAQVADHAG